MISLSVASADPERPPVKAYMKYSLGQNLQPAQASQVLLCIWKDGNK